MATCGGRSKLGGLAIGTRSPFRWAAQLRSNRRQSRAPGGKRNAQHTSRHGACVSSNARLVAFWSTKGFGHSQIIARTKLGPCTHPRFQGRSPTAPHAAPVAVGVKDLRKACYERCSAYKEPWLRRTYGSQSAKLGRPPRAEGEVRRNSSRVEQRAAAARAWRAANAACPASAARS